MTNTEGDVESAYGSECSSHYSSVLLEKTKQLSIEEPKKRNAKWNQRIKFQLKEYMILEVVIFVILVLVLWNSYKTASRTEQIFDRVNNIEAELMKSKEIKQFTPNKIKMDLDGTVTEKIIEEAENVRKIQNEFKNIEEVLMKSTTASSPIEMKPIMQTKKTNNSSMHQFNAANYLLGGRVDSSRSSSSNLNPSFGIDQSDLVLLDRSDPPADRSWCSNDKEPILTINLVKYVKPISVSYQHSKWNGTIPNGAPKIYSVMGCLDYYCKRTKTLATCEYKSTGEKEQLCPLTPSENTSSIIKVQIRILKNYGNSEGTCVSLFRVNGQSEDILPKPKQRSLYDSESCSVLTDKYHNKYWSYYFRIKNCKTLYDMQCCQDCPECCDECLIHDFNGFFLFLGCAFIFMIIFIALHCCGCCPVSDSYDLQ